VNSSHRLQRNAVRPSSTMFPQAFPLLLVAVALAGWAGAAWADLVRFRIQPERSEVTFQATSRLVNADGRFHRFRGEVLVDPSDLATARVTVTVEAASIDTANGRRDNHLRDEDFFHVERFPSITFESLRVEGTGRRLIVVGRLTVRGVTREMTVPVEVDVTDLALTARGEFNIRRTDYDITYQSFLNPVGDTVRIGFTFRGHRAANQ